MGNAGEAPESITLEFLTASGQPVRLIDLGQAFLTANGIDAANATSPFRVAIVRKKSKAGNAFYDYSQNSIPLPDGLSTFLKLEGAVIPMGRTRPSQKGYPTREGTAQVMIGGVLSTVTAYITQSRVPFFVKVLAHKTPDRSANMAKAQLAPKGGRIIT